MKKGDKVMTWTSNKIGKIIRMYSDGTVDVKYPDSNVIHQLPIRMCQKV